MSQGHIDHPECIVRNQYYDAEYCSKCDVWLEKKCDDHRCNFCPQRPEKPSECYYQ